MSNVTVTVELETLEEEPYEGVVNHALKIILDGDEHVLRGSVRCGWIAPRAHADLDGSGLSSWGDSQPGGWWSVCNTDIIRVATDYFGKSSLVGDGESIDLPEDMSDEDIAELEEKIESLYEGLDLAPEPSAQDVCQEILGCDDRYKIADYCGCGPVLAWQTSEEEGYIVWPNESDIAGCLERYSEIDRKDLLQQMKKAIGENDD